MSRYAGYSIFLMAESQINFSLKLNFAVKRCHFYFKEFQNFFLWIFLLILVDFLKSTQYNS